jgi:hypothetical protein
MDLNGGVLHDELLSGTQRPKMYTDILELSRRFEFF